jgi:hypothetical protein
VTGAIICAAAVPVAWATGFLKTPAEAAETDPRTVPAHT